MNGSSMVDSILNLLSSLPETTIVTILATLPILELRGAIPIGIIHYEIHPFLVYFLAVLGNMIPVIVILALFEKVTDYIAAKSTTFKNFLDKVYQKTRHKHQDKFNIWGALALITFVAIPLPFTGAWSGSLAAIVFKVPWPKAILYIFIGILISGFIVTSPFLGIKLF